MNRVPCALTELNVLDSDICMEDMGKAGFGLGKGILTGTAITGAAYWASHFPAGRFVLSRVAFIGGAMVLGETLNSVIELDQAYFSYSEDYYDIMGNPLISESEWQKFAADVQKMEQRMRPLVVNKYNLKHVFKEDPEGFAFNVGTCLPCFGGVKALIYNASRVPVGTQPTAREIFTAFGRKLDSLNLWENFRKRLPRFNEINLSAELKPAFVFSEAGSAPILEPKAGTLMMFQKKQGGGAGGKANPKPYKSKVTLEELVKEDPELRAAVNKAQRGIGIPNASSATDALRLKAELSFKEAGFLDEHGRLTFKALENKKIMKRGDELGNKEVIKELTKNGENIKDWGKYTTVDITLGNGQKKQIHFYYNRVTKEVNYTHIDFKIKDPVEAFDMMRIIREPIPKITKE